MNPLVAQLSCQQCHDRKKKCDKTAPCSACLRAAIPCTPVQRSRLPRGRSGNKKSGKSALKDRVGRLEAIIGRAQESAPERHAFATDQRQQVPKSISQTFIAPAFWSELADAVAGVKDALEGPDEAEYDTDRNMSTSQINDGTLDSHALWFGPIQSLPGMKDSVILSTETKAFLLDVYRERVDAIFKVLHWPTTYAMLKSSELNTSGDDTDLTALETAIYFTAMCSLLDHEFYERQNMVVHLRRATERALAEARLLTTTSFIVLQAFVVYLAGLRASQANAQQWTLTATAIRIASAQGIPAQHASPKSNFQHELQTRLWFCIGILDLQSAFDRGSRPLLSSTDFQVLPLEVNDMDLNPSSVKSVHDTRTGLLTDMKFSMTTFRAMICQHKLVEIASSVSNRSVAIEEQAAVFTDFEDHVKRLREHTHQMRSSIDRFTAVVAEASLVSIRLLMHRPLCLRRFPVPDPVGFDILATATEVLERKRVSTEFMQWTWFSWVKWYALAIVLAELCTARGPQADRAWSIAQTAYDDYASSVADTSTGLLWRPIVKLMRRVRAIRSDCGAAVDQQLDTDHATELEIAPMEGIALHSQQEALSNNLDSELDRDGASMLYWDSLINDIMLDDQFEWNFAEDSLPTPA